MEDGCVIALVLIVLFVPAGVLLSHPRRIRSATTQDARCAGPLNSHPCDAALRGVEFRQAGAGRRREAQGGPERQRKAQGGPGRPRETQGDPKHRWPPVAWDTRFMVLTFN